MKDYRAHLETLNRPRLLIRAARSGIGRYKREHITGKLPGILPKMSQDAVIEGLISLEHALDSLRRDGAIEYDVKKHILTLTALIAESGQFHPYPLETKMAA